jgi:hypothetical protein
LLARNPFITLSQFETVRKNSDTVFRLPDPRGDQRLLTITPENISILHQILTGKAEAGNGVKMQLSNGLFLNPGIKALDLDGHRSYEELMEKAKHWKS